jgi:hypothetical protein
MEFQNNVIMRTSKAPIKEITILNPNNKTAQPWLKADNIISFRA